MNATEIQRIIGIQNGFPKISNHDQIVNGCKNFNE